MKPYEIIEHTADVGIKANGATLKELFENAARGMFGIIGGGNTQQPANALSQKNIQIKKEVDGLEELLVDWLSELLYIFNKDRIFFSDFKVLELNNSGISGEAFGHRVDLSKTTLQTEIKDCTFHGLKIEEHKSGFSCSIIFDV